MNTEHDLCCAPQVCNVLVTIIQSSLEIMLTIHNRDFILPVQRTTDVLHNSQCTLDKWLLTFCPGHLSYKSYTFFSKLP